MKKEKLSFYLKSFLIFVLIVIFLFGNLSAISSPTYQINESAVASGGETTDSASYSLKFAVGTIAGFIVGDIYDTSLGFFKKVGDILFPSIFFQGQTPETNTTINNDFVMINISSSDDNEHSTFLDWNRSLVGWWRFERNASDSSNYGNDGTINGDIQNVSGKRGMAYEFDGAGDYVKLYGTGYDGTSPLALNNSFAISFWVYSTESKSSYVIGNYEGEGDYNGNHINIDSDPVGRGIDMNLHIDDNFNVATANSGELNLNQWYHIVVVRGREDKVYMYVDGIEKDANIDNVGSVLSDKDWVLGAKAETPTQEMFKGSIDDVMLFDRALNESEIKAIYNAQENQYYNNFTNLDDGNYTFKGYAVDSAGNLNSTEEREIFLDTNSPEITIHSPENQTYNNGTILVNISASDVSGVDSIWYNWNGTNASYSSEHYISVSEGDYNLTAWANDSLGNIGFENVSFSYYPPSISLERLYPTENMNVEYNEFFNITLNVTCLDSDCGDVNVSFDPEINVTDGLVGYWALDGNLSDLSSSDNHGNLKQGGYAGSSISEEGKFIEEGIGGSFHFDNPDTCGFFISLSERPLDPQADNFSFSMWIKPNESEGSQNIYDQVYSDSWYGNHHIFITPDGELKYRNRNHQVSYSVAANTLMDYDVWQHISVIANTTHLIFYINGVEDAVHEYVNYGSSYDPTYYRMGEAVYWNDCSYSRPYKGLLDELAIWNHSLSEEEIQEIYNNGDGVNLFEISGKGLISDTIGDTPFYTNESNPRTLSGMTAGESRQVTAWVNATGDIGNYTFFEYANRTANMSISNVTEEYVVEIIDTQNPEVNIIYPENTTYDVYATELNFTASDNVALDTCWYSLDEGVTNETMNCNENITDIISERGSNTWTIWVSDTSGNTDSDSVTFSSNTPLINLERLYPIENISVNLNEFFNITLNVTCLEYDCGDVNTTFMAESEIEDESFESGFGNWANVAGNDEDWQRKTGSTGSSGTGPSSAYDGDYYIYVETSSGGAYYDGDESIIEYDDSVSGVDFYYHQYGSNQGTIYLEGYDGSSWNEIWNSSGNQGDQWNQESLEFSSYEKIRFRNVAAGGYTGDIALDLITVSGKSSISDTLGNTPFYTNESNPRTINLNAGQSQLVTAWVNATGDIGNYTFFEYANRTADMITGNVTEEYVVTIFDNTPPTIDLISPESNASITNRTPTFEWNGTDKDGDDLTYTLNITCHPGCSDDNRLISGITEETYTITNYLKYLKYSGSPNYYYNWSVKVNDSQSSVSSEERKFELLSEVSMNLSVNSVNFGSSLLNGESDNTTNNNPEPISMENTGNSLVNISINSTQLWNSKSLPSEYYQFKISEDEPNSFDLLNSLTSWVNFSGISTLAIADLNWSDESDTAKQDIAVRVPENEPPGNKSSTITIKAIISE